METSRRRFLQTTLTAAAAACAWQPLVSISRAANENPVFRRLDLGGAWQVSAVGKEDWFAATTHDREFVVTIHAENPALWVWFELENADARFSDNFFHLQPGEPLKIRVQPNNSMTHEEFISQLRVRSLYNTYTSV